MSVINTLPDEAERPQPIPDVEGWSENICFTGWDAKRRIGVFVHQGRTPVDPEMWHEIVAVHLPDGTVHVGKNFSVGTSDAGPKGSLLSCEVVTPWTEWSVRFHGPLRVVQETDLWRGPLLDGPQPGVRLDLDWTSDLPIWDFGSHGAGDWASRHYQQLGSYRGRLVTPGLETDLEMVGWRDHSTGARNVAPFVHHTLVTAQFEDGRSLFAVELKDDRTEDPFLLARYGEGTEAFDLEAGRLPVIDDVTGPSPEYEFEVLLPSGPTTVRVHQECNLPVTMFAPNDMVLGLVPAGYCLWMGQARFEMDGVVGYGYLERAARVPAA